MEANVKSTGTAALPVRRQQSNDSYTALNGQVFWLLHEISHLADSIKGLTIGIIDGDDTQGAMANAVKAMSGQIGAFADLARHKINGDPGTVGGFENWVLPPAYHEAAKQGQVEPL